MKDDVLEAYIKQVIESQSAPEITIAWQGGEPGLNNLFAGYKAFFTHVDHPMRIMAQLLRNHRYADEVMGILAAEERNSAHAIPKVSRNEPCPCGSDKKYKHCHGRSGS